MFFIQQIHLSKSDYSDFCAMRIALFSLLLMLQACAFTSVCHAQSGVSFLRDTFCGNQSVLINGELFGPNRTSGQQIIPNAAANGSDSIINVELVFRPIPEFNLTQTLCAGDTLFVNGKAYHKNFYVGQEIIDNASQFGCDSIVNVNLTFKPVTYAIQQTLCEGESITINGRVFDQLQPNGQEFIPAKNSGDCDSLINVNLTFVPLPFRLLNDTLCPGASLTINGNIYDTNNRGGLEILKGASYNGCDSLVFIELEFRQTWVYLGEDSTIYFGDAYCMQPKFGLNPEFIQWLPPAPCTDPSCETFCISPSESVRYVIRVTDDNGCLHEDDIVINISKDNRVFAPNIIDPEADFPNNTFFLGADQGVQLVRRLIIADRWGEILFDQLNFEPNIPELGWNGTLRGKPLPNGVCTFWAELERIDGSTFIKAGTVMVLR